MGPDIESGGGECESDAGTGRPLGGICGKGGSSFGLFHGTAVAAIASAGGNLSEGRYQGVAPESGLIVVKLGSPRPDSFPRTTELMRALAYMVRKAVSMGMPLAINLSFGNTYGSHDGTSLLERFLDNVAEIGRTVICVGSGNEGAAGGHVSGKLPVRGRAEGGIVNLPVKRAELNFGRNMWISSGLR